MTFIILETLLHKFTLVNIVFILNSPIISEYFDMKMIRHFSKAAVPQLRGIFCRSTSSSSYINNFRIHTPEDGFVVNSIYEPITLPDMTVDQYVWKNISKWQNKVAVVSY